MHKPFTLKNNCSFIELVTALDKGGIGFLSIVNENNKLVGVVSDGDVRRAVLENKKNAKDVINEKPFKIHVRTTQSERISILRNIHRRHAPLVDDFGYYKGIFSFDDIDFISKENLIVVMAGGLGSRLGKLTQNIPKPMLEIRGKPILLHTVESLRDQGFKNFVFCVNYKKEIIKKYFKSGKKFGISIKYIEEKQRLGTAGALSLFKEKPTSPFFVINADVQSTLNYDSILQFHKSSNSSATMSVMEHDHTVPYGVVTLKNNNCISSIDEKPVLKFKVNTGIYVLSSDVLEYIPRNEYFDMTELFKTLVQNDIKTTAYPIDCYWVDIGKEEDLAKARKDNSL